MQSKPCVTCTRNDTHTLHKQSNKQLKPVTGPSTHTGGQVRDLHTQKEAGSSEESKTYARCAARLDRQIHRFRLSYLKLLPVAWLAQMLRLQYVS
eukprot:1139249-Pelagomonas_calceolata.AAC.1